jgi:hypothetical protein
LVNNGLENEMYEAHVSSGSKKDEKVVMGLVTQYRGKVAGVTDKGAVMDFGRPMDRDAFVVAVNSARLTCYADACN